MRFTATLLLWLVTTVTLVMAVPAVWAQENMVDADGYAAMARKAAGDPALQSAMASELTTRAMAIIAKSRGRGYPVDSSLVHAAATAYTAGAAFPPQFAQANRVVHNWMFTDSENEPWVIDLAPMLNDSAFAPLLRKFNAHPPATVTVPLTAATPKSWRPGQLRPVARWGPWVSVGAMVLTGIAALLTLATARSRARALTSLGVSALLVGGGGWAAIEVGRRYVNDALNHTTGDIRLFRLSGGLV